MEGVPQWFTSYGNQNLSSLRTGFCVTPHRRSRQTKRYSNHENIRFGHLPGSGTTRQLEYDFVVSSGADPKPIQLSFPEAREIRIDRESGDLELDYAGGGVRFHKPVAY